MQGFKIIFESYGANYQETMNRFINNEKMYLKFLDMLFKDTNLQLLGESIEANDLQGAFNAAHTLKGVVGNMGLTPLYNAVCKITEYLRVGEKREDYLLLYQDIQNEFNKADVFRTTLKEDYGLI